ncbi:MAG: hypothetical protein VB075_12935, partial [Petrimonas sp.]|uniref:hypothetical protein n=1 Tax=Petrimonas sp. TaxID=2023866 RepID=UPI002B384687|nr:hypothetical protein [Petrimonas sp.]
KVAAVMGNIFLKFSPVQGLSLESFTTLENAGGRDASEPDVRKSNQFVTDLVVRFGTNENFYVGGRYNTIKADMGAAQGKPNHYEAGIDRVAIAAGWYMTKNVMAKIEYVNQKYNGFPAKSIQDGAKFNGLTLQGSIAF